jgi:3',5'-cyclic AMP phosphodiesterase CpdA
MIRLAHLSDLHFGRIAHEEVVDRLRTSVNDRNVDLVAISGDLTQRARPEEFEQAVRFIEGLEAPVIVVPGNHDIYPWWRPAARLLTPLNRYREWVTEDMVPSFSRENLAVLGVNSAHGWGLKNGWIRDEHIESIVSFFEDKPSSMYKVLVLHHHLKSLARFRSHDVARRGSSALEAVKGCQVDLVLCGHLHESHIEQVRSRQGEHQLVVSSAGTASSDRGRGKDIGVNGYNLIEISDDRETVAEKRYNPMTGAFEVYRTSTFTREHSVTDVRGANE